MNEPPDANPANGNRSCAARAATGGAGGGLPVAGRRAGQFARARRRGRLARTAAGAWVITRRSARRAASFNGRPRHAYHVNARAAGDGREGGDGSEESPWWGMAAAVGQLIRLDRVGQAAVGRRAIGPSWRTARSLPPRRSNAAGSVKETIARLTFMAAAAVLIVAHGRDSCIYLVVQAWPVLSLSVSLGEPQGLHDRRRHLGAAGGHVLPGLDFAVDCRSGGRAGRRLSQRIRPRQLAGRGSSTWRW